MGRNRSCTQVKEVGGVQAVVGDPVAVARASPSPGSSSLRPALT